MMDAIEAPPAAAPSALAAPTPQPSAPQTATPAPPANPLAVATATAAGAQGPLAPLLANLAAAVQTSTLPRAVQAAAARVLALQPPLADHPTAGDLKQGLAQSGLMLEARIAADGAPPAADAKAALLVLRQALEATTPATPSAPASTPNAPAPPYRGGPLAAQPPAPPSPGADPANTQKLLQQTTAALSRQTLFQLASAPAAPQPAGSASGPLWQFELPFATPQGAAMVPFEISRDDEEAGPGARGDGEPAWRARFAVSLESSGPVHARISVRGGRARVTLWAEREATAGALAARQADLAQALLGDNLIAAVKVLPGAPDAAPAPAGQFLDKAL